MASVISPPAAAPWMPRTTTSCVRSCAAPHRAEAATNTARAPWSRRLRPWRSPSLPQSGVDAVAATTYAVTSQETSLRRPRSVAIVGSAVARIVWSSTAGSIARTRAAKGSRTEAGRAAGTAAFVMIDLLGEPLGAWLRWSSAGRLTVRYLTVRVLAIMHAPRQQPIGLALGAAAKRVSRAFDDALAAAGGSRPVWLVLLALKAERPATQRELAEAVGIEGATLTHHLDGM